MRKLEYFITKSVQVCQPDNNLAEVGATMWQHNCGALPVLDNNQHVIGIITDRDICIALTTRMQLASEIKVYEAMSTNIHCCSITDGVADAIDKMRKAKVRRLPVLDKNSKLVGIITLSDILRNLDANTTAGLIFRSIANDTRASHSLNY